MATAIVKVLRGLNHLKVSQITRLPSSVNSGIYDIYKFYYLTAVNMNLLCASFVGDAYKCTVIFNKYVNVAKDTRIHYIFQGHESIFQCHTIWYFECAYHIDLRVKREWYFLVPL